MSVIATAASVGSALFVILAASSGPFMVLAGFFAGGTLGGLFGALAVAALGLRGASA